MIKEILIFMLILQISDAENLTSPNCDEYTKLPPPPGSDLPSSLNLPNSYDACKNCDGYLLGHLNTICIPSFYKDWLIYPPFTKVPMYELPLTTIKIQMSNIEVIEINIGTIKVNMDLRVFWYEYRLREWINPPQSYTQFTVLSKEDREIIWSPEFVFRSGMVSAQKIDVTQGVGRYLVKESNFRWKAYQLSAIIKCEMDFQKFPFDEHVCNLEVGSIISVLKNNFVHIFYS